MAQKKTSKSKSRLHPSWQTSRFLIDLTRPKVMGIVNITPDSFSDGGQHNQLQSAMLHCEQLIKEGADLLDIGGESTRPGATPVPLEEELARVLPLVREALTLGVPISVDTYKPQVMQAVLDLGADIINDVCALHQPNAQTTIAAHPNCGICLMHMHLDPTTMQISPMRGDVVAQVALFLEQAAHQLEKKGVEKNRIVLDPGIGFGKTTAQNFSLLAHQNILSQAQYPILTGWSRKSALGAATGLDTADRMIPSVAAALLAVDRGARIVRVHDVAQTVAALQVWNAAQQSCH